MIDAFGGESQAFMRYTHFARKADKEGYSQHMIVKVLDISQPDYLWGY